MVLMGHLNHGLNQWFKPFGLNQPTLSPYNKRNSGEGSCVCACVVYRSQCRYDARVVGMCDVCHVCDKSISLTLWPMFFFLHLQPFFGLAHDRGGYPLQVKFSQESKSFFKITIFPMLPERSREKHFVAHAGRDSNLIVP